MSQIMNRLGIDPLILRGWSSTPPRRNRRAINNWFHLAEGNSAHEPMCQVYDQWLTEGHAPSRTSSRSEVDLYASLTSKEQLKGVVPWIILDFSIFPKTGDINVYHQGFEAVRCWWSGGEVVMTTPTPQSEDARKMTSRVIASFAALLGGIEGYVAGFVFKETNNKLRFWAVHKDDSLETQLRLAQAYTDLRSKYPTQEIDFMYFSEREFKQVNLPEGAIPIRMGGDQ